MMAWPSFSAMAMNCWFWNMPDMACMYLLGSKPARSGGAAGAPPEGLTMLDMLSCSWLVRPWKLGSLAIFSAISLMAGSCSSTHTSATQSIAKRSAMHHPTHIERLLQRGQVEGSSHFVTAGQAEDTGSRTSDCARCVNEQPQGKEPSVHAKQDEAQRYGRAAAHPGCRPHQGMSCVPGLHIHTSMPSSCLQLSTHIHACKLADLTPSSLQLCGAAGTKAPSRPLERYRCLTCIYQRA